MSDPRPAVFTLDALAHALRGMPRDAPMLVRLPDGSLRRIVQVAPAYLAADASEMPAGSYTGQAQYAIVLELEDLST